MGRRGSEAAPARRKDVLRAERVAVAGVPRHEVGVDERVERAAKRLQSHAEPVGERDELRPAAAVELGQHGQRPPEVEEA